MENTGDILRKKRLEKGLTYEEIEKNTRIRRRYLEAMEKEEWHVFPGTVYLKGFLKSYCRYLGVDEKGIIRAIDEQFTPEPAAEPLPRKIELPGRPRRKVALILGIIAIIIMFAVQTVYKKLADQPLTKVNTPVISDSGSQLSPQQPEQNPPAGSTDAQASQPPAAAGDSEAQPQDDEKNNVIESLTLRIKVINKCWVIVKNGNQLVFEGTLQKGEEKTFAGLPEIYLGLGNAGGVEVYLNERDLGVLGSHGDVVYKRFTLENNEVKEINISLPARNAS